MYPEKVQDVPHAAAQAEGAAGLLHMMLQHPDVLEEARASDHPFHASTCDNVQDTTWLIVKWSTMVAYNGDENILLYHARMKGDWKNYSRLIASHRSMVLLTPALRKEVVRPTVRAVIKRVIKRDFPRLPDAEQVCQNLVSIQKLARLSREVAERALAGDPDGRRFPRHATCLAEMLANGLPAADMELAAAMMCLQADDA